MANCLSPEFLVGVNYEHCQSYIISAHWASFGFEVTVRVEVPVKFRYLSRALVKSVLGKWQNIFSPQSCLSPVIDHCFNSVSFVHRAFLESGDEGSLNRALLSQNPGSKNSLTSKALHIFRIYPYIRRPSFGLEATVRVPRLPHVLVRSPGASPSAPGETPTATTGPPQMRRRSVPLG